MGRRGIQLVPTGTWEVTYQQSRSLADTVINFIQALPTPEGIPFELLPWQRVFLKAIYKTKNNKRVVRTALLSVARKNGKTGLSTGIILAHMFIPELRGMSEELYSVASDREQSSIVYNRIVQTLLQCPELLDQVNVIRHRRLIEIDATSSKFSSLASDAGRLHGLSPAVCIYDELAQAKTRDLYDALKTAGGARSNSLLLVTSTQAATDEHVMSELYDYGVKVNSGKIRDESFHATIYSAPIKADITKKATWQQANPSLGRVRNLGELKSSCEQLKHMPQQVGSFRNLYLNQRVHTERELWFSKDTWDKCGVEKFTEADLRGARCVLGIDAASVADLTAIVAYFPDTHHVLVYCFVPKITAEKPTNTPYRAWQDMGLLEISSGPATDINRIYEKLAELTQKFNVERIGYDRWRLENLKERLADDYSIPTDLLTPVGQGYVSMSPACAKLEQLVLSGKLRHAQNPVLTWQVENVVLERDAAGNKKPNKSKAKDKIDAVVALLCSLYVAPEVNFPVPTADELFISF